MQQRMQELNFHIHVVLVHALPVPGRLFLVPWISLMVHFSTTVK
jgi:hypothetical protein